MVNYLIFAGILYSKQIKLPMLLAIEPEPKTWMEDYSSNEKVKPEKQIRNIMYMLFGQCVYIYVCNVCIELFI